MGRHYGFQSDNFLGLTPLKNDWADDLATFFIQNRLLPQLVAVSLCVCFRWPCDGPLCARSPACLYPRGLKHCFVLLWV